MAFLSKKQRKEQKRAAAAAGNPAVNLPVANNSIDPGQPMSPQERIQAQIEADEAHDNGQPVGDNTGVGENTKEASAAPVDEATMPAFVLVENSSQVAAYGYMRNQRQLFIRFKSAGSPVWRYDNVDEKLFQHFLNAESKGKFLNSTIKPNHPATRES